MDATAVSAARGCAALELRARHVVLVALFFGGFQALMPLAGWLIGSRVGGFVQAWDHWVAFVLLSGIGAKMLLEARGDALVVARGRDLFALHVMFALAVATSIDALAVGFSLPLLNAPLLSSVATIGLTTAVLSALGLFAGRRFGAALGRWLDAVGGIVLVGLGTKILLEHLTGP
jgi:putative Mn2+ efflux pump MntP